jgi:hypothetical protein
MTLSLEANLTDTNRASGLALNPLRPCGFSAYQRYGHFFRTPIFGILVKIEEKYFIVYMEFIL